MNRRDFLQVSAGSMLGAFAGQLPIRRSRGGGVSPSVSGGQRLLSLNDLTWLGTFKSPNALATQGGVVAYPWFTLRRVGGVLKTLWLGADHGGGAPNVLIQADYPGYNPVLANSPASETNVRNFGNGFLTLCLNQDGTQKVNSVLPGGIHWDDHNNCVWFVYGDAYNAGGTLRDPVLIRGDINDSDPDDSAVTWSGPWRLDGSVPGSQAIADCAQTQSYIVSVPPSYGTQHLSGATIALGGSYNSLGSAYNNVLWAPTVTPTSATTPSVNGGADLSAQCLIGGHSAAGQRGRRPGDYITESCGGGGNGDTDPTSFTRGALTGYWGTMERSGSVVWLDWDTVRGVLFFVAHGRGHIWYNTAQTGQCNHGVLDRYTVQGPEAVVSLGFAADGTTPQTVDNTGLAYGSGPDIEAALYAYDPDTFVPVAGGNPWDVPVHDWGYVLDHFPDFVALKTPGAYCAIRPNGMSADETSRLIMIPCGGVGALNGFGFYVNVFSVA